MLGNNRTIGSVFNSLTKDEKDRVYWMVGDIVGRANITISDIYEYDLSFLGHEIQRIVVRDILRHVFSNRGKE